MTTGIPYLKVARRLLTNMEPSLNGPGIDAGGGTEWGKLVERHGCSSQTTNAPHHAPHLPHSTMSVSVSFMSLHPDHISLGIHRGALDHTLVTTEPPPRVMRRIRPVLDDMGVLVQVESEFRLRCIRRQQKRPDTFIPCPVAVPRPAEDAVDEVRFSVELTRLDGLHDTFSLDVRRLKGNLRSYKLLYDTLRQRAANLL